ncbi:MAG: NAD(P)H-hydrate epimerase [Solirubrobacterales bacterium]
MGPAADAFPSVDGADLPWITVEQMRTVDRVAIELGLSLPRMMENAGGNLTAVARAMLGGGVGGRRIVVAAGPGGNGGGGMVAARRLAGSGARVRVHLGVDPEALAPIPREQYELLGAFGVPVETGASGMESCDLFIDALLGYSQTGAPRGGIAELVSTAGGARVLSLDVPTGLELASGDVLEPAITADATMTLALPKEGLRSDGGRERAGALYLADISIGAAVYEQLEIPYGAPFSHGPIVEIAGS